MAKKRESYKVDPMTKGKKNIISSLLQEYDIKSAEDIQNALKDLLEGTLESMLQAEMDQQLGYDQRVKFMRNCQ